MSIEAEGVSQATVTFFASGEIIHRESVELRQGTNNYTLPLEISSGFREFTVQVEPESDDAFYQNNRLATFTNVVGPPRVLVVSDSGTEVEHLIPADLRKQRRSNQHASDGADWAYDCLDRQ